METIDIEKLSQMLKNKRGNRNLREVAEEIKNEVGVVSISTLSRIEQGKIPDLATYMKLCEWLNVSPEEFTFRKKKEEESKMEKIFSHIRSDQSLPSEVSDALTKMIELAYKNSELSKKKKS